MARAVWHDSGPVTKPDVAVLMQMRSWTRERVVILSEHSFSTTIPAVSAIADDVRRASQQSQLSYFPHVPRFRDGVSAFATASGESAAFFGLQHVEFGVAAAKHPFTLGGFGFEPQSEAGE